MTYSFRIECATNYSYEDIEWVKAQRKFWARREQEVTEKSDRKYCQKYIKATTLVIQYMEGDERLRYPFPIELTDMIKTVFCFATDNPRTEFKKLHNE